MADSITAETSADLDQSAPVAPSPQEDTRATDDVELEDIEISLDELDGDDDETNESNSETESPAVTEQDVEEKEESEVDGSSKESTDSDDTSSQEHEISAEERKRLNDEYAKRRILEKQLREERAVAEKEKLERFIQEAGDDDVERARRELEVDRHLLNKEKIEHIAQRLELSIDSAVRNIDLFKTGTPEQKEELARSLDDFEARFVQKDRFGNYVAVMADPYDFLQDRAQTIQELAGVGAQQQAKNKQLTKAKTDPMPTKAPKTAKVDTDLDDFDRGWNS